MNKDPRPVLDVLASLSETDSTGWGDNKRLLMCPVCGFDYTHAGVPAVEDGEDNYQASWDGRGDLIAIPLTSECGSKWELCIGFHKGQSAIFTRLTESCEGGKKTAP